MQHPKHQMHRLAGNRRGQLQLTHRQSQYPHALELVIDLMGIVAIDATALAVGGKQGTDGIMSRHLLDANLRGLDPLAVNIGPIGKHFHNVTRSFGDLAHEFRFEIRPSYFSCQLDRPRRVAQNLNPFRAR